MIFDNSSASFINLFMVSFSSFKIVSLIRQSQYFVSFDDFKAIA